MDFVPYRLLRNQPGQVRERLAEHGQLVITNEGQPIALMVSVDSSHLEELVVLLARVRAQLSVSQMRRDARTRGLDQLDEREIQREIRSARKPRRR
jgi:antitoxin (DNA-binding transcriptional repressor) of toxin-antitoxin stability system